ncbi:hypothetical protein FALCPG4_018372 [Fusarium falciforme]
MNADLTQTIHDWRNQWNAAVDQTFLDPCVTYIDIGRQYTPRIGSAAEANVLLWRRCCLKRLWRQRQCWSRRYNATHSAEQRPPEDPEPLRPGSAPLRLAEYPKLTMRDTVDMTIKPTDGSREILEGLVYSQFYNLIKVPFDVAKQYPFQNRQLEKMALDPSYLDDCEGSTRGNHANQASLKLAYRLSKLRVRASLVPDGRDGISAPFTYGVRAEDRVSLALLERIVLHLDPSQTTTQGGCEQPPSDRGAPFFAVQSRTMARFLHGTINKYCFLFEYIKSQTADRYSLPETIVMILALRSLRLNMSGIIAKESVLWRDRWKSTRQIATRDAQRPYLEIEREGLGLYKTSKDYGLGWWLPGKFDWDNWRFKNDVGERLMVGNNILLGEYGRQWKIIRDIRDVHTRMWQAQQWAHHYSVRQLPKNRCAWLEYLYSTVIELFQCDVWLAARKSLHWKSGSDLTDEAAAQFPASQPPPYCYDILQRFFHERRRNISHTRPHFLTGNKIRFPHVWDLVCELLGFDLRDGHLEQRKGLRSIPYRIAVRRSIEMISDVLGHAEACGWFLKLGHLLLLTHWILPWPSNTELISTTKESQNKNLKRRLTWVSLIHVPSEHRQLRRHRHPAVLKCPMEDEDHCITTRGSLQDAFNAAAAERFGSSGWTPDCDPSDPRFHWTPESLLQCTGRTIFINSFKIGRAVKPGSRSGFIYPLVERGHPPVLRLVNRIRGRTLEELDQLFGDLIISVQSEPESQGDTMNTGSPLPASTSVVDPGAVLESRYLAALWEDVQARAAPFPEYAGLRLYMAAKNTKLTWMRPTLESTLEEWHCHWDSAVDETYVDPQATYIDIGRQLTPAEMGPRGRVLLWRRCCLDRLWRRRLQWSQLQNRLNGREEGADRGESGKRRSPPIRRTTYPFVTLRDARDMTITPGPGSWELQKGLVYSQFYNLVKVPFDAAKQYPFQNRHTESMALDPSYLLDQRNSTRGAHAHQSRVQCAYRLSKLRIHRNLPAVDQDETDDDAVRSALELTQHQFTYGIRAEDRVSLALLRRITDLFSSAPAPAQPREASEDDTEDYPFFAVPSQTMARFLRASINRYCFLFEYIKAQTGLKYSLPETIVMATALRGLRFSYDSSLITKEPVLWGDRWTSTQRTRPREGEPQVVEVQREGLGLGKTSKVHGFGWWLPGKFDWNTWRFASEVGDRLAVGNDLLRQDYKRQWRVLKDIRDVHVRMWQAQSWAGRYQVHENVVARRLWLEYLHSTVIELFQRDVWRAALKSTKWKTGSDVTDEAMIKHPESSPPAFCYDGLSDLFHDRQRDIDHTRPHLVTGNKLRSTNVIDLFDDLFSPSSADTSMKRRRGWSSLPFRIATRRSIELVEMTLGSIKATQWYAQLRRIVLLTHWILPWPSDTELLTTTKESRAANLKRRLTWASVIHVGPSAESTGFSEPSVPTRKVDDTDRRISTQDDLSQALSEVCRYRFGDRGWTNSGDNTSCRYHWSTRDLARSTRDRISLDALQLGRAVEPFKKGWIFPVAEAGRPPQLRMVGRIRDKTLDELDRLFFRWFQEHIMPKDIAISRG